MTNFVTSLIRTYVPIIVGALVAWLATIDLAIAAEAQAGLVVFLTALLQGAYYTVIRLLERKFPKLGLLLGSTSKPAYAKDVSEASHKYLK